MSSVRRHSIEAIGRHSEVRLIVSGPGWPDYNQHVTVQKNLDNIFPDANLVLWHKPLGSDSTPSLGSPHQLKVPTCIRFNEAWWPRQKALNEVLSAGSKLVICHHANDIPRFNSRHAKELTIRHIPLCAEKSIFAKAALPDEKRDIPVLLTGFIHKRVYPIRYRMQKLIQANRFPGKIRQHPSYEMKDEAATIRQVHEYAEQLGRAKIVLVDSSRYKYPLAKYTEAAMAGALVLGDLPNDPPPGFQDFLVPISRWNSNRKIIKTILSWLNNDEQRIERAKQGQTIAATNFTQESYAQQFVDIAREFLGERSTAM